jgi:hypothetical protein
MAARKIIAALVIVLATITAASAQSAYTTGTIADSEAAGYPSPYGFGSHVYAHVYAYAPSYVHGHRRKARR